MCTKAEIEFSLKYLNILEPQLKSTVFSSASILNVLAMIYSGTDGITAEQLEKILGGDKNLTSTEILKYYSNFGKFCEATNDSSVYKLLFSNRLFLKKSDEMLLPSFKQCMEELFNNDFEQVDFSQKSETTQKINNFVSEKTEGHIKGIITEEDVNDRISIFIVNALCFIGEWEERFQPREIKAFYSSPWSTKYIDMISLDHPEAEFNLTKGQNWRCLGIPYKTRNSFLHILLPNSKDGLSDLLKELDYEMVKKCIENNIIPQVFVTFPAFEIEEQMDLKEKLELLGLTQIFSDHGIQKMFQNRHIIEKAIHKAGIKVDENGTFGYAAAAASGTPECAYENEFFIADHPFIYFVTLVENKKPQNLKSILLMGTFC